MGGLGGDEALEELMLPDTVAEYAEQAEPLLAILEAMQVCGPPPCPYSMDEGLGALLATGAKGCDEAVGWLLEHKTAGVGTDEAVPKPSTGKRRKAGKKAVEGQEGAPGNSGSGAGGGGVVGYEQVWNPSRWEDWPSARLGEPGAVYQGPGGAKEALGCSQP